MAQPRLANPLEIRPSHCDQPRVVCAWKHRDRLKRPRRDFECKVSIRHADVGEQAWSVDVGLVSGSGVQLRGRRPPERGPHGSWRGTLQTMRLSVWGSKYTTLDRSHINSMSSPAGLAEAGCTRQVSPAPLIDTWTSVSGPVGSATSTGNVNVWMWGAPSSESTFCVICSGRMPNTTSLPTQCLSPVQAFTLANVMLPPRSGNTTPQSLPSSTTVPRRKFMDGEPMKLATNRFAG